MIPSKTWSLNSWKRERPLTTTQNSIPAELAPWEPADPKGKSTGKYVMMPAIFCATAARWQPILGPAIDEMTSDPRTLDLLSALVVFSEPPVIVEVGTYRGWGTAILAETLRFNHIPGHVWSCDPV